MEYIVTILTIVGSAVTALLVAYFTARWQVSSSIKTKASERRFDMYDRAIEMLVQLEQDPVLSLDEAFLARWYLLARNLRSYASKKVADAVDPLVDALRDNYKSFEKAQEELHGEWFEGEPIYSDDGLYSDVAYRLVRGEYWEYTEELNKLSARSSISPNTIESSIEKITDVIRKDCGLG